MARNQGQRFHGSRRSFRARIKTRPTSLKRSPPLVLAIDQGTTGSRAILYDRGGQVRGSAYQEITQHYPQPGWVEHDAGEILHSTLAVVARALSRARAKSTLIESIGITNQRETAVLWDRKTGQPVSRAIVWQDRRTAALCEALKRQGREPFFRRRTGLILDPYFSGTKIRWLLDAHAGLRRKIQQGKVLFGTIDTWLLWNLSGGKIHATDVTNASRTLLLNLKKMTWDPEILKILKIPSTLLPELHPSSFPYGRTATVAPLAKGIPLGALVGDQQAALFGQGCYRAGEMKNTYGTGCFLVMNEGKHYRAPSRGLLGTLACDSEGQPSYALEGAVFIAGAAIQWIRDGLGLIHRAAETEKIARGLPDTGGVFMVPAFTGLGAPYWNPHVRGAIFGLTRGTRKEHLIKAALESIAYQTADVFEAMTQVVGRRPAFLKVDGGAAANDYLMQFQADLLGVPVIRSERTELTAWGAAKLAGLQSGFWKNTAQADRSLKTRKFVPRLSPAGRSEKLRVWRETVQKLLH